MPCVLVSVVTKVADGAASTPVAVELIVTGEVADVTMVPAESSTRTCTAGLSATLVVPETGTVANDNFDGEPVGPTTTTDVLVVLASPDDVAVSVKFP